MSHRRLVNRQGRLPLLQNGWDKPTREMFGFRRYWSIVYSSPKQVMSQSKGADYPFRASLISPQTVIPIKS